MAAQFTTYFLFLQKKGNYYRFSRVKHAMRTLYDQFNQVPLWIKAKPRPEDAGLTEKPPPREEMAAGLVSVRRPQNASFANSESQTESSAKTIKNEHGAFLLSINNKNRVSPALLFADNKF